MKNPAQATLFDMKEGSKEVVKEQVRKPKKKAPKRDSTGLTEEREALAEEDRIDYMNMIPPHMVAYTPIPGLCMHGQKKHQCGGSCFK